MAIVTAIAVAAIVAGTAIKFAADKKSAKLAKRSEKERRRVADAQARRERLSTIRERRQRAGQLANVGAQVGATDSTALAGSRGSLRSQEGRELGFSGLVQNAGKRISRFNRGIASAQQLGGIGSGIASIGSAVLGSGFTGFGGGGGGTGGFAANPGGTAQSGPR